MPDQPDPTTIIPEVPASPNATNPPIADNQTSPPVVKQTFPLSNPQETAINSTPFVVTSDSIKSSGSKGGIRNKKLVTAILGILILIGGTSAGLKLIRERQIWQEKGVGSCGPGCGNEPDYDFNKPPSIVGPFTEDGTIIVYYSTLGSPTTRTLTLRHNGTDYTISLNQNRQRIVTNIQVSASDSVELIKIEEQNQGSPQCAPESGPPYYSWGWIDVNSDITCGSGLPGPPSQCLPFEKINVADEINWAQSFGQPLISKQCWADWREWPGDYDFNDFFLTFSLEPEIGPTTTPTTTPTATPTATPATTTSTPAPTAPPGIIGRCLNISAYTVSGDPTKVENWKLLDPEDLAELTPGTKVYFTVSGTMMRRGTLDKARFSITHASNVPNWRTPVTTKMPEALLEVETYYDIYTIPEDQTNFIVNAQLHYQEGDIWF